MGDPSDRILRPPRAVSAQQVVAWHDMLPIQPGELVRLRHNVSLGEVPVVKVLEGTIFVDIGHRVDGELVGCGYERAAVISEEEWPAEEARRRKARNRSARAPLNATVKKARET